MNSRERTLACLRFEALDRYPTVHFGFWRELLHEWAEQGHLSKEEADSYADGNAIDADLCQRLGFDHCWAGSFGPNLSLDPSFAREVVREVSATERHVRNAEGVVELEVDGAVSIPAEIEHTLVDRASWENHYKWRLQWHPDRVAGIEQWQPPAQSRPLGLFCGSLIGKVRNVLGITGLAYLGEDDPELLREIIDTCGALCLRCVEETLRRQDGFDFGAFWEDICFNHGPLVSPAFFAELVIPWYRKITTALRDHGIDLVSVDCDGCIDALLPHWLEAGVNIMFPIEVGTWGASIAPWRDRYGGAVRGVGGVRKQAFAEDRAAVDAEVERLRPLLALGGYVPCPDHRLPPGSDWDLIRYYNERLKAMEPQS